MTVKGKGFCISVFGNSKSSVYRQAQKGSQNGRFWLISGDFGAGCGHTCLYTRTCRENGIGIRSGIRNGIGINIGNIIRCGIGSGIGKAEPQMESEVEPNGGTGWVRLAGLSGMAWLAELNGLTGCLG